MSRGLNVRCQAEMAGSPDTKAILDALHATRASARERQEEVERRIREEARNIRQGVTSGSLPNAGTQRMY